MMFRMHDSAPGGCMVRVSCIKVKARLMARGADNQNSRGPNAIRKEHPTIAERICPPVQQPVFEVHVARKTVHSNPHKHSSSPIHTCMCRRLCMHIHTREEASACTCTRARRLISSSWPSCKRSRSLARPRPERPCILHLLKDKAQPLQECQASPAAAKTAALTYKISWL